MDGDGWIWDASATLAAVGAGGTTLWVWAPDEDRLRLTGATRDLGLAPLAPECSSAALRALALPADRHLADELLTPRAPGADIAISLRLRGAGACIWRGQWQEDGRAAGVVAAAEQLAGGERDGLTGAFDRRSFVRLARDRLQASGRHALIVADLDRLRRLNEALGHERADLVLAALAVRLTAALPPNALTGRIGEDEFAVLCPAEDAPPIERLRAELEAPLRVAGLDIHPKLSFGVVEARGGPDAPEAAELLRRAELRVAAGKARKPAIAGPTAGDGLSRLALEAELEAAIAHGELTAYYQPIVHLGSGDLAGFEALARWRHPRRGVLTPEQFLPLCEELGLMGELGSTMRAQAAEALCAWRRERASAGELTIAVNLSVGELERPDLPAEAAALRRAADLPPGALKLEVTEGEVMRDPERAATALRALRAAGLKLAIDDFGVGFSSLSYLTRLPFDAVKIDSWFVRAMAADPGAAKIVSAIVRLGRELDLEVVAEGVEDLAVARRLFELGCHFGQGFGFSQALSPEAARAYVDDAEPARRRAAG